uniref:hypothetical protein n=1 Tax=Nocardia brasiliensis TaxID=37326 RepID=UPI0002526F1E
TWRQRSKSEALVDDYLELPSEDQGAVVRRMQRDLDTGRAFGIVRLLTRTGDYEPFDVVAKLIVLNRSTTAALITVRRA